MQLKGIDLRPQPMNPRQQIRDLRTRARPKIILDIFPRSGNSSLDFRDCLNHRVFHTENINWTHRQNSPEKPKPPRTNLWAPIKILAGVLVRCGKNRAA